MTDLQPAPADGGRRRFRFVTRRALLRLAVLFAVIALFLAWCSWTMLRMPGSSFAGPAPVLDPALDELASRLKRDVVHLGSEIGPRNTAYLSALRKSESYLRDRLAESGRPVQSMSFMTADGTECTNFWIEYPATTAREEIIVVGAHYDSFESSPGANDNGTGVAAVLALADRLREEAPERRALRLALFVNEEPPYFQTDDMGSLRLARAWKAQGAAITAMISLETIGCFHDEEDSQRYPIPLGGAYPTTGNFLGFVGPFGSRDLVRRSIALFREHGRLPSEGAALPGFVPGISWSDHWAFAQQGWPAIMVTDTAPFRYAHYHEQTDMPQQVDFRRLALVVEGMEQVIASLRRE